MQWEHVNVFTNCSLESRDDSTVDLLTIYSFALCVSFSFWHEEGVLLVSKVQPHLHAVLAG